MLKVYFYKIWGKNFKIQRET